MRKLRQKLLDGTGYINRYVTCRKFTCQLHFDNIVPATIRFKRQSISVRRINMFRRLIYLTLIPLHRKQLTFRIHLNLHKVITLFHGYFEVPNNNVQQEFVYFNKPICCSTLTSFLS